LSLPDEQTTDSARAAHGSRLSAEEREALLRERVEALPTSPGVYRFRNARGRVLYVGKAQNLRARVRSYFGGGDGRLRVPKLVDRTTDVDVVVTESVKDALLLENELIKQHKPPFNVRLRDDKQYLVLRLDPNAAWPRLTQARRFARDGAQYFGPYTSARAATACFAITRGADDRASSTR
jgi:excinuclease ABC subunit C